MKTIYDTIYNLFVIVWNCIIKFFKHETNMKVRHTSVSSFDGIDLYIFMKDTTKFNLLYDKCITTNKHMCNITEDYIYICFIKDRYIISGSNTIQESPIMYGKNGISICVKNDSSFLENFLKGKYNYESIMKSCLMQDFCIDSNLNRNGIIVSSLKHKFYLSCKQIRTMVNRIDTNQSYILLSDRMMRPIVALFDNMEQISDYCIIPKDNLLSNIIPASNAFK